MNDQLEMPEIAGQGGGHSLAQIEALEAELLHLPQIEMPVTHTFAPGVYFREIFMPKDTFVIGHCHKTEHLNVILQGSATVLMNGELQRIAAPDVIKSGINVRKVLYIEEDMRWATVHPTMETDLQRLEEELIVKSSAFLDHQMRLDLQKLRLSVEPPANQTEEPPL